MTYLNAVRLGIATIYEKIVRALVIINGALILFMMISISASVIFRKTALDFGWALEVSEYILIIITLFGAGWLLRTAGHIRVDIVATHIHGKQKALYNAIIFSIVSLICIGFTVIGVRAVIEAYSTGTIEYKVYFEFKKWILHSLFPLAGFVMWIESTKLSIKYFKGYISRNNTTEE